MHAVLQTAGGKDRGGGARIAHEAPPVGTTQFSGNNGSVPAGASSTASGNSFEIGSGGGGTAGGGEGQGGGGQKAATGLGGTAVAGGGAVNMWTSLVDVLEVTMAFRH